MVAGIVTLWGCGGASDPSPFFADGGEDAVADGDAVAGTTLGAACSAAGELACQGVAQKLQLLCDGTKWVSNGVCAGDQLCDPRPGPTRGSCQSPPAACTSTATVCDDAAILKCGADRLSVERIECASPEHCKQAISGVCAKCLAWEVKCEGAELKKCALDRQSLVTKEVCATPALCNETSGVCKEPACAVGDHWCSGDTLEGCKADRTGYEGLATCGAGLCDATLKTCRECLPSAKGCAGDVPRTCDSSGKWMSLAACSGGTPVCKDGSCIPAVCALGDHRCSGDVLEQCNSTRTAFDPVRVCAVGMCDATGKECNECTPGTADCVGSTPRACDSSGKWKSLTACSGMTPVCKSGVCTAFCLSGEHRCSGDVLERCNSSLSGFETVKTCGAGLCDATGKECDECKPGEKSCLGTVPRLCDSTGHWGSLTACSGSSPTCSGGACIGPAQVYSGYFTNGVSSGPTTTQCTSWNSFRAGLTGTYSKVTISGTLAISVSCTGTNANTLCNALRTGTAVAVTCDGRTWRTGECGTGSWELTTSSSLCFCEPTSGYSVRPCVGNANWGGAGSATCNGPTQGLKVICE